MQFPFGQSLETGETVYLPRHVLNTHLHLLGATGVGKTTFLRRILTQQMVGLYPKTSMFVIDPLGGLADSLVDFIAHPTLCTDDVRDRLVYIEPANTDYVMPFNSLLYGDEDDLYYKTGRTSDCFIRSAKSHDIEAMPRLRRWLYNCFYSVALLGLPPAAAQFLLQPGTTAHNVILDKLPQSMHLAWAEVLKAGLRERIALLDSTRNRTNPFFTCPVLNRMLSQRKNFFDVPRFIRERKIVIVNLACKGKIDPHVANTIGSLMVNEILQQARNMPRGEVYPCQLVLDEFQNFVGQDLYDALPEVRQLGIELLLSHQSFTQLERGDIDMRGIVWQARSRGIFCSDNEDADLMAHELASQTYNPMEIKDQIESFRQKKVGQEIVWLESENSSKSDTASDDHTVSRSDSYQHSYRDEDGLSHSPNGHGFNRGRGDTHARRSGRSTTSGRGRSQSLIDVLEDFYEVSNRTFYTFDEQMRRWAQYVRKLKTGQALCKFRDDDRLHKVQVDNLVIPMTQQLQDRRDELIERNFCSDLFLPKQAVEAEWTRCLEELTGVAPLNTLDAECERIEQSGDSVF